MKVKYLFFILIVSITNFIATAQNDTVHESIANEHKSIVEHITADNNNSVTHPDAMNDRLLRIETEKELVFGTEKLAGYRIQVFSDNNSRTAKGEARARARNINVKFPEHKTYVIYNSPFWRLRVGNFRTHEEANAVAEKIKEAFPSYSKEIRIVKDRVVITTGTIE